MPPPPLPPSADVDHGAAAQEDRGRRDERASGGAAVNDKGTPAAPHPGQAVTPIPIEGGGPPTPREALSVSPAAAFAKLGLTEAVPTSASVATGRKLPVAAAMSRRRSSTQNRRPAPVPHPSSGVNSETHLHPHSTSLPASSLLLLSTSAEAAVLESMRFEQGGRSARQAAAMSLVTAGKGPPGVTSAPNHAPTLAKVGGTGRGRPRSSSSAGAGAAAGIKAERGGERDKRERGQVFKCEKCAKVYRHPQCLVKHRWEHTTYWADASKLMLSKHQQVQMLEAAAILATPYGSLPESRSLWPAAVSPSAAGLFGSDRVNIDVLHQGAASSVDTGAHFASTAPADARTSISLPVGGTLPAIQGADDDADGEREDVEEDEELDEDDEDSREDSDDVMFEMSINGDDGQSTSGASTAETTSGKASGSSGDEKDSGYASTGPTASLFPKSGQPPVFAAPAQASPPVGFFDTRARSSAISRSVSAIAGTSPSGVDSQGSGSASSLTPTTKAILPPPSTSAGSPMLGPVPISSSFGSAFGPKPLRPSERAAMHTPSSFFVQNPYAASDVRATLLADDEVKDEKEEEADEMMHWRREASDEVVDMEL